MLARILHRSNESNFWAELNPILKEGEIAIESDTGLCKIGDGETVWNELKYSGQGQQYFVWGYGYIPKESKASNLRGYLTRAHTGILGKQTDRMFIYVNKTVDGETTCQLTPISYFADIRDQAEIKNDEGTESQDLASI